MTTLYLCGAGNPEGVRLALTINRAQNRWNRIILLDDDPSKQGQSILGVEIAGPFTLLGQADPASSEVVNLVARTTRGRRSAQHKIEAFGLPFTPLIDSNVDITWVEYGRDITVYRNATFCASARVDEGSIVFGGAMVGHGSRLGRCCVLAPGAVVNARVELGDGVYVGTNASILPDLKVGSWATIGANSAVIQDVPAGATVMGVPAQVLIPGGQDLNDESIDPPSVKPRTAKQAQIKSEALKKLRIAQERYMESYRTKRLSSSSFEGK
jgi:sugar O-acyltransferase (sialic acid O-acetyltransferase NeuD family)